MEMIVCEASLPTAASSAQSWCPKRIEVHAVSFMLSIILVSRTRGWRNGNFTCDLTIFFSSRFDPPLPYMVCLGHVCMLNLNVYYGMATRNMHNIKNMCQSSCATTFRWGRTCFTTGTWPIFQCEVIVHALAVVLWCVESGQVWTMHTVSLTHSVSQPGTLHLRTSSPAWILSSETSTPHMQAWRLIVWVLCTCCIRELSSRIGSVYRISLGLGYAGMGSWGSLGVIALSGSVLSQTVVSSGGCNSVSTIRFLVAGSTTATVFESSAPDPVSMLSSSGSSPSDLLSWPYSKSVSSGLELGLMVPSISLAPFLWPWPCWPAE